MYTNEEPLNRRKFRKISRYVLQEDYISPHFTVAETMMMASHFKLNTRYTRSQREQLIDTLLEFFHLTDQAKTRNSKISGGERKRVCIAMELINNPAVLFLDEPTTGLDESAAFQCIMLLKQLTNSGHTVVCSLHSPSYRLLQRLDHIYTMAEGQCIYQGKVCNIIPYLDNVGLSCPLNYNPADFIIESATHSYGNFHEIMVTSTGNGKISKRLTLEDATDQISTVESSTNYHGTLEIETGKLEKNRNVPWYMEYIFLLYWIIRQSFRDKINIRIRIFVHLFLVILIGYAYDGVGINAFRGIYNYHLTMITVVLCVFTSMTPVVATSGPEMKYLQRQHLNQWYSLSSYFLALMTTHLIMALPMSIVGSAFLYFLSNQPLELFRFVFYTGIIFLTSIIASSYGLLIGSRFKIEHGLFLAPAIMGVFIMLANYATEKSHMNILEKVVMYSSCLRYSIEGILAALFNYNRPDMICPPTEFFCVMSKPRFLLKLVGSLNVDYWRAVAGLVGFYILFSAMAYLSIRWRLIGQKVSHLQLTNLFRRIVCCSTSR